MNLLCEMGQVLPEKMQESVVVLTQAGRDQHDKCGIFSGFTGQDDPAKSTVTQRVNRE